MLQEATDVLRQEKADPEVATAKPLLVIFDLDGTLADMEHRVHLVRTKPKNFPLFNSLAVKDDVYTDIAMFFDHFIHDRPDIRVYIVTGREGTMINREIAWNWLYIHNLIPHELIMRAPGDYRKDFVVKEEILHKLQETFEVFMVFEDRKQVVDMYRRNGIRCLQVKEGDF